MITILSYRVLYFYFYEIIYVLRYISQRKIQIHVCVRLEKYTLLYRYHILRFFFLYVIHCDALITYALLMVKAIYKLLFTL